MELHKHHRLLRLLVVLYSLIVRLYSWRQHWLCHWIWRRQASAWLEDSLLQLSVNCDGSDFCHYCRRKEKSTSTSYKSCSSQHWLSYYIYRCNSGMGIMKTTYHFLIDLGSIQWNSIYFQQCQSEQEPKMRCLDEKLLL